MEEECKTYLLNRINSNLHFDFDGFVFDNVKYNYSQITQFIENIRKVSGFLYKVGLVYDDDSQQQDEEEDEVGEESSNGMNDYEDENTENNSDEESSDSGAEKGADSEEEETICTQCQRQYSSKSNLRRHIKIHH
jgi:hypothetical protein